MRVARASEGRRAEHEAVRERLAECEWSAFIGEADAADGGTGGRQAPGWCYDALAELVGREYVGALTLGPVVVGDARVVALVVFDDDRVYARAQSGVAPALDRITLRERLEQGGHVAVSPVREVAFVGVWGRTDLTGLTRLGGYGETLLLAPPTTLLGPVELAECDWRGVGVWQTTTPAESRDGLQVRSEDAGARWLVLPGVRARPWSTNMRYEQLLDLAMRAPSRLKPCVPTAVPPASMAEAVTEVVDGSGGTDVLEDVESTCDHSVN